MVCLLLMTSSNVHETNRNLLQKKIYVWLHVLPLICTKITYILTFPSTSLEQLLRAIWNAVSCAIVLILSQIKLKSQLSRCAFFCSWQKKSEEVFCFYKNRIKVKIAFNVSFAGSLCRGITQSNVKEWHRQAPSLGTTLSIKPPYCVCEHLCFISTYLFCAFISKMCPKVIALSISVFKRFHRNALLSIVGETIT